MSAPVPTGMRRPGPADVPAPAATQALQLVTDLAVTGGRAGPLLLAATGRPALPVGYSVL